MSSEQNPVPPPVAEPPPPAPAPEQGQPALKANAKSSIVSRREFITILIGAGATLVAAATLAEPLGTVVQSMMPVPAAGHGSDSNSDFHWGMVIDLSKCVGCYYCVHACQATNDTRSDGLWNILLTDTTAQGDPFYLTRPCLHCQNAPCVSVCPVSATYKRADGLIMMNYDRCIGCRYCQTACPYGARVFNWRENNEINPMVPEWGVPEVPPRPRGVVEKCTFCVQRIDFGLENGLMPGVHPEATPACVNICPVTARFFGNLKDPNSEVSRIIATKPTLRLREDLGTDPSVYYIPPEGMI